MRRAVRTPRLLRLRGSSRLFLSVARIKESSDTGAPLLPELGEDMHATVRRYEGIDETRREELTKKVTENLIPRLSKLPGFNGYYVIEAGNGVITSVSLFDTEADAAASTELAAQWIQDDQLTAALPNAPKVTSGRVVAAQTNGAGS
jgi:hypothetical protein